MGILLMTDGSVREQRRTRKMSMSKEEVGQIREKTKPYGNDNLDDEG